MNDRLETTAPNVRAMGESAGSPYFTHVVLEDDANLILENSKGGHRSTKDRLVPYCVFIDPELARVGLNETQARARGVAYRLQRCSSMPSAGLDHLRETWVHEDAHRHTVIAFSGSRRLDLRQANSWVRFNSRC